MRTDLRRWQAGPGQLCASAKSIALVVEGGLAEQIAAEPAVRYAREVLYPADRTCVGRDGLSATCFSHLKLPRFTWISSRFRMPPVNRSHRRTFEAARPIHATQACVATARRRSHCWGASCPRAPKLPGCASIETGAWPRCRRNCAPGTTSSSWCCCTPVADARATRFRPMSGEPMPTCCAATGLQVAVIGERKADFAVVEFDTAGVLEPGRQALAAGDDRAGFQAPVLVANDSAATRDCRRLRGLDRADRPVATPRATSCTVGIGSQHFRAKNLSRTELFARIFTDSRRGFRVRSTQVNLSNAQLPARAVGRCCCSSRRRWPTARAACVANFSSRCDRQAARSN